MAEPKEEEVVVPPPQQEELNQDMLDLMADPEMQQLYEKAYPETALTPEAVEAQSVVPKEEEESQSSFWKDAILKGIAGASSPAAIVSEQLLGQEYTKPVIQGGLKAAGGILDTAASITTGISANTGLYQLNRTPEEETAFLEWYESPSNKKAPVTIGGVPVSDLDKKVDDWMGPSRGGISGFIEGSAQFAAGMAGATRMLASGVGGFGMGVLRGSGALESGAALLSKGGVVGKYVAGTLGMTLKGAISDAAFFNPWEQRLADMLENSPPVMSNAISRYLSAPIRATIPGQNDSESEARLKRALEGVMLGSAVDGLLGGLRVLKVRFGFKSGAISKTEAEKLMEEAGNALEKGPDPSNEVVHLVETGDGKFAVEGVEEAGFKKSDILTPIPEPKKGFEDVATVGQKPPHLEKTEVLKPETIANEQELADVLGPTPKAPDAPVPATVPSTKRMVFSNQADAQSVAATINQAVRNKRLAPGKVTEQSLNAWRKMRERFGDTVPDANDAADFLEESGFKISYTQKPEDIIATIKQLVDDGAVPISSSGTRRRRTHEEMLKAAQDLLPGTKAEDALGMAERVFGSTERLAEELLALRAVLHSHGRALKGLSLMVESSPNNKLAMDQLAAGLDTLMDLHALITGAQGNNARALNVGGISSGRLMEKLGDPGLVAKDANQLAKEAANEAEAKAANGIVEGSGGAAAAPNGANQTPTGLEGNVAPTGKPASSAEATNALKPLSPTPTQRPGAPEPAVAVDAAKPEVVPGVPSKLPAQPAGQGVVPVGEAGGFQTMQGLKEEMKAHERLLKDLKSRPDRAANQVAISEVAGKIAKLSGQIIELKKTLPKQPPHLAPMGRRATEGLTMDQIKSLARNVFMADGDPAAILWALRAAEVQRAANKLPDRTMARKMYDWALNFRIEGMLSAPTTHLTNIFSNLQVMLMRPAEYWMAGWMPNRNGSWNPGKWKWADHPELRQEGADMLVGLFAGWRDTWAATKQAFVTGKNVLDPQATVNDGANMMLGWNDSSWLQKLVHAPSRLLMASDELFKNLNYRASMRAQILRHAREMGVSDPTEIAKRLVDDMQMSFGPNGAVNPRALEYARTNTFTNPLEYGWGKGLQKFAEDHPSFRLIMPFIRTPTNIFRFVWQRTPLLNQFQKQMVDDLTAGGERAALARAKTAMGVAIWGSSSLLISAGVITGKGPSDPELRRQMTDANWQPYSIRIGDRYVSYRKADPVATTLGMIADIVQITGELREKDQKMYMSAAISAIISNLSNKSYMQGLTDVMDAVASGDERKMSAFVTNMVGSFVPNILRKVDPMVNIGGQAPGQGPFEDSNWVLDDTSNSPLREARGFVDGLMNRIPGFSSTLPPRRNIFGEKVMRPPGFLNQAFNPFTVSGKVDDDSIQSELIRIGKAFPMPTAAPFGGMIDLRDREAFDKNPDGTDHGGQSPYDRMLEVMANPPENGWRSLKEELTHLIKSEAWKEIHGEDAHGKGGLKYELVQNVVSQYHEMALAHVRTEYPTLNTAWLQAIELEGVSKAKGREGVREVMQKYEGLFGTNKSPVQPKINWR